MFTELGEIIPDKGFLGIFKRLLDKSDNITPQDKETALKLLEMDLAEMQEVSNRWEADMASDSWLNKNTRPLTLIYLTVITTLYIILDSMDIAFDIDGSWV